MGTRALIVYAVTTYFIGACINFYFFRVVLHRLLVSDAYYNFLLFYYHHRFLKNSKNQFFIIFIILFIQLLSYNSIIAYGSNNIWVLMSVPVYWFICCRWMPVLQYLLLGGPSLGTYLILERLFMYIRYSN